MKFRWGIRLFIFILLFASSAHGQWKMIKDFGAQVYSIHFLDREGYPQIGFVGLTTGAVWRTSDGGATWQKTTTPASLNGAVRDFTFKDSLTGWLASSQSALSPACFETTDAGLTWIALTPTGLCTAIFYNLKTQALILNGWNGAVSSLSVDGGLTWTGTGNMTNSCGFAFTDSLNGIMSIFPANIGGTYSVTSDGGLTWQNLTQIMEAWQPLAIKGTNTYFICAEGAREILRSDDRGKNWSVVHIFPATLDLTGDIRGDLNVLYVQSKIGTFYSVDQGVTWTNYCGPDNDFDTRLYLIGEDSLYAGTLDGKLWLNPFGVKNNNKLLQFPKSPFDLTSSQCFSVDSIYRFINLSNCLTVKLLDVAIIPGTGSNTLSFKKPVFPLTLPDSGSDSIKIIYTPDNNSADSAQLDIKYSVGSQTFEVKQWLRGFIKQGFNVSLSKDLNLLLSSGCSKLDTFVIVKSGLCSEDTLINVQLSDPTAFSITPPVLPSAIPVGKSIQIPISVKSLPAGSYSAFITLTIRSGGITKDTTINLTAIILASTDLRTNILPDSAIFGTVQICNNVFDTIIITNTICKELFIKNITIQPPSAASEFSFTQPHHAIPDSLQPKGFDTIIVEYKPTVGGLAAGYLRMSIGFDLITTRDTNIGLYGIGKALAGSALESNLLQFADTVPCSTQQLSTKLYNNGCGTDTIVAIIPASDQSFTTISPAPPLAIASGDSTVITIQEDPLSPGAKFDSVGVIIHSSSGAIDTARLKISGIVNKPIHKLSLNTVLRIDSIAPCTQLDTILEIKNLGTCDTLSLDQVTLNGPAWFTLGSFIQGKLLPGKSIFITIHFTPGAGAKGNGSLILKGNGIDTAITISANSRIGGPLYVLSAATQFTSSLCKPALETFSFENTSCDTIILDQLLLKNNVAGGTQFSFTPAVTLPDTLVPGKKLDIVIQFDPLGTGDSTATLTYHSTVNNITSTSNLTGKLASSKQTAHLELLIGANGKLASVQARAPVTVRLMLQDDVGDSLGLKSAKATLTYNDDVLGNASPVASAGWSVNSQVHGKGAYTLDLSRTNTNSLSAGTEIATVKFDTYIADSSYTPMDLQNLSFNNGDPTFLSCVLSPLALAPIQISIDSECGSTVLRGFLNGDKSVFSSISIRPNPAASGTQINIGLNMNEAVDLNITVSDMLGQTVSQILMPSLSKGIQNISLGLPSGANGLYILTLEAGGMRESRKIVIEK